MRRASLLGLMLVVFIAILTSCSHSPPEPVLAGMPGTSAAPDMDEVIIDGDGEVTVRIQGIKGAKGDKGDPGEQGEQGPPGTGGGLETDIWINVKEHGAKGDGKTDDTQALKQIMADAPAAATIKFPSGIYPVNGTLENKKNLNIIGSGSGTRIYQSADKPLFRVSAPGSVVFSDLWLASGATSEDAALILLEPDVERGTPPPSHIKLRNIFVTGGWAGICMKGVLFPRLDNIQQAIPWNASDYPTSIGKAGIYAEHASGRAVNSMTIINPVFQGGYDRGIWVNATRETGVTILGGCLESMREASVVLDNVSHYTNIIGTHFEGREGTLRLNGCQQVNIHGVLGIGRSGIVMKACTRTAIRETYGWHLDIDASNRSLILENILYKTLKLGAQMVKAVNFNCTDNQALGPYGTYTSELPENIEEFTNGSLESWTSDGKPIGFTVYGNVREERNIVYEGHSAARVEWSNIGGLRFDVPQKYIQQGGVLTVFMMCYKPEGGFNPRITGIYNNWNAVTAFPVIELPTKEWQVARATFNVPSGMDNMFIILPSGYAPGKQGQELVIDWIRVAASY